MADYRWPTAALIGLVLLAQVSVWLAVLDLSVELVLVVSG